MTALLAVLASALAAAAALLFQARARRRELEHALAAREEELRAGQRERAADQAARAALEASLAAERKAAQEKLAVLGEAERRFVDTFHALSSRALQANNDQFLQLARESFGRLAEAANSDLEKRQTAISELVRPVRDSLEKVDEKIETLERARTFAYASLSEQVRALLDTQNALRTETGNLVKALRAPAVRGRWGEMQLQRVVEMAGMLEHCDFVQQQTVEGDEGRLRPDLVVRFPGGKRMVVDAKAPLAAYLDALEATTEDARAAHLAAHARQLRNHVSQLARKAYWDQFQPSPEFVVMFLPGEMFFSAALQQDPSLIESGVAEKVIPATPTTLIALLRAVAYGWRQEALAKNAQEVADLGKQLYERIATMASHWSNVGDRLDSAVKAYNDASASLETRVLVSARKLRDLKAGAEDVEIKPLDPLDRTPRKLQAVPTLPKPVE